MTSNATTNRDLVLSANLEFYRCFTARDLTAMDALWARHLPVACVHPGWSPLLDRASIMTSWGNILSNPDAPRVVCHDEEVFLYTDFAYVICEEELPGSVLVATNSFAREEGVWRLVHHQASPLAGRPVTRRTSVPPRRLN